MASRLGGGGARGEEAPSAARKLSEAMRYFEPPPRSPWTFRLAVLGVLLGSLAIVLQAYTLSSRGTFSSASWSSATPALAAPRAPVPPPESTHPPPSLRPPAQIMAEPAKTPPPPPLPNLMIAADASTFAGTDLRVPPPTPAPPTPTPVFIPLSDDVASTLDVIASAAEDGESRRRRKGGRRGGSVGDDSLDAGQPINATERMVSREMDGAANATGLHGGLWNATSEWKGRTGKGRGGKGRGGRGGGGKGQDDGSGGARDGRPNLLLMIADDAATADVGALGGGTSSTPNIDSIWRRGARFTSAHAASPLCTPSRFAVLTGQRPSCAAKATTLKSAATTSAAVSQGPLPAYVPMDSYPRPSRHRTLGHRLGEAGYATGIVGLWHLGAPDPVSPSRDLKRVTETDPAKFAVAAGGKVKRAVTTEYAALQEHVRKVGGFEYAERLYAAPLDSESLALPSGMRVHNVEWVADGASQFIQSRASAAAPFFLFVGWTLPHGPNADRSLMDSKLPYTPNGMWKPNAALSKSALSTRAEVRKKARAEGEGEEPFQGHKNYAAALQWLDRGVGTVIWALQRKGVMHSTLVAFTSDHGNVDKAHCYWQGTHVPLLMQWPDAFGLELTVSAMVSLLDVTASFLDAAGLGNTPVPPAGDAANSSLALPDVSPNTSPLHGVSLLPALRAAAPKADVSEPLHEHISCEVGHTRALMTANYKYIYTPFVSNRKGAPPDYGASERHPAIKSVEQLYSVVEDLDEVKELIAAHGLLTAPPSQFSSNASAASSALTSLRALMHSDLSAIDKACGV